MAPLHCEELLSRDQSEKRSLGFPSEGFSLGLELLVESLVRFCEIGKLWRPPATFCWKTDNLCEIHEWDRIDQNSSPSLLRHLNVLLSLAIGRLVLLQVLPLLMHTAFHYTTTAAAPSHSPYTVQVYKLVFAFGLHSEDQL